MSDRLYYTGVPAVLLLAWATRPSGPDLWSGLIAAVAFTLLTAMRLAVTGPPWRRARRAAAVAAPEGSETR